MPGYRPKPSFPVLNRTHPLARGLKIAIPFTEGGGAPRDLVSNTVATDVVYGSGGWRSGLYGPGLYANASRYTFGDTDSTLGVGDAEFTIFLVFRSASAAPTMINRTSAFSSSYGDDGWSLAVHALSTDDLRFSFDTSGGAQEVSFTPETEWGGAGERRIAVIRRAGGSWELWQLGELSGTATNTTALSATSQAMSLVFGATETDNTGSDSGLFHAYYQWSRALSGGEIEQLFFDPFAIVRPRQPLWMIPATGGASAVPAIMANYRRRRAG